MSYTYEYPRPMVTVDAVVFRQSKESELDFKSSADCKLEVLLIRRKNYPFEGMWALPGGFVDMNETLEKAAVRELKEETGLSGVELTQLFAFSTVNRDPRGRNIGIAFYGFTSQNNSKVKGGDDASEAQWFPVKKIPRLAFDHDEMIEMAYERMK
ncbi:MAG: NUDIX hydrolase [Bacteroidales bacterium]|nr:NUDIX hydrolase [Bacteroidales bacterium]